MTAPAINSGLRESYLQQCDAVRRRFENDGSGLACIHTRSKLVDELLLQLWQEHMAVDAGDDCTLVALGGYGREQLFPSSDVDILFLYANAAAGERHREAVRRFSKDVWDLHLRFSPASRILSECDRVDPENLEFTISLLDCRYVAGSRELFGRLHDWLLPGLIIREHQVLIGELCELTRNRHHKFGATVFHLEPNLKNGPGGLRDYHVATWLALISAVEKMRGWPGRSALFPESTRRDVEAAFEFMADVRCFLHYERGRDDNLLGWHAQDAAAQRGIGLPNRSSCSATEWMRLYFRHARGLYRHTTQLIDEISSMRSSLYRQFQSWRSRVSNADFSVVNGFVFLQQPGAVRESDLLLRLFQFVAHHGLKLATTTEQKIQQALPSWAAIPPQGAALWQRLCEILYEPRAADALRAMHHLSLLTILLPELQPIDALVVRDYYHRFTVDEHSFVAIDTLHRLRDSTSEWHSRFAELFNQVEQPELLFLALLLHDVGKAMSDTDHVHASMDVAERCLERLDLAPGDRETVLFLIENHLEVSARLRRDIFDSATVASLAEKVETPDRLRMLCLLTFADINAVNPEALTPWKAEGLWQLYIATANHLNRTVDEPRLHGADSLMAEVRAVAPKLSRKMERFVSGLPHRYLRSHRPAEIVKHVEMAEQLSVEPLQLDLQRGRHNFELTVITRDRQFLFSNLCGVLTAWGMDIIKAHACSNGDGVVVDTFSFADRFHTLELNLSEWDRLKCFIRDVLAGEADLERALRARIHTQSGTQNKTKVSTQIEFDDHSSAHSTLLQLIASDRPGLLHRVASCIANHGVNVEIALIDTEGEMAIDVFYLTSKAAKLTAAAQSSLREALLEELAP